MTDDKDKKESTEPTDTSTAEAAPAEGEAQEPPAEDSEYEITPKRGGQRWVWALVVLVLVIAAGEGAFIWWYDQQLRQSFEQTRSSLRAEVSQLEKAQQQHRQGVEGDLQQMRKMQQQLQTSLQNLLQRNQHLRKDWLLLEAEYLVKLANHRLLLEEDIDTALVAQQAADQRLKQTGDPGAIKLRERIAQDIQALRNVPQADVTGLSLKLSALHESIDNLPLATPDPRRLEDKKDALSLDKEQVDKWTELPAAIWSDLKSLVDIRHHDKKVEPLLSPEQRFFLVENIRLQLEQARLALLGDEPSIYFQRLEKAEGWLKRYFDADATSVSNAIETLQQLRDVTLDPAYPDLSATYQALHDYQQKTAPAEDKDMPVPSPEPVDEPSAPKTPAEQQGSEQPAPAGAEPSEASDA